jgi:hypothetical protein
MSGFQMVTVLNISEKKKKEKNLRSSENLLSGLLPLLPPCCYAPVGDNI